MNLFFVSTKEKKGDINIKNSDNDFFKKFILEYNKKEEAELLKKAAIEAESQLQKMKDDVKKKSGNEKKRDCAPATNASSQSLLPSGTDLLPTPSFEQSSTTNWNKKIKKTTAGQASNGSAEPLFPSGTDLSPTPSFEPTMMSTLKKKPTFEPSRKTTLIKKTKKTPAGQASTVPTMDISAQPLLPSGSVLLSSSSFEPTSTIPSFESSSSPLKRSGK